MRPARAQTVAAAMLFETALGFVGVVVAWLGGVTLSQQMTLTQGALLRGLLASLPMIGLLVLCYEVHWRPLVQLRRDVERVVEEIFAGCTWWDMLLVSLAAGVGEEVLFRGALQTLLIDWTHAAVGVALVSLLFGLAHALSTTYFLVATAIGVYFGWMAWAWQDLVAPVVAHATYDFVALVIIQSRISRRPDKQPAN